MSHRPRSGSGGNATAVVAAEPPVLHPSDPFYVPLIPSFPDLHPEGPIQRRRSHSRDHHSSHVNRVSAPALSPMGDFKPVYGLRSPRCPLPGDEFSFTRFLQNEMRLKEKPPGHSELLPSERIHNFFLVPACFERLMWMGFWLCMDSFLFLFTILPVRIAQSVPSVLLAITHLSGSSLSPQQRCDWVNLVVMSVSVSVLWFADTSMLYHFIRAQSIFKLYVIFTMLHIFDKLCCSFGEDILDSLRESARVGTTVTTLRHALVSCMYVVLHSVILFAHVVTLNVAINSTSSSLLTLLVSNNFVELKGSVFKKFSKQNLFQIAASDITERFQLFMFLLMILAQNIASVGWLEAVHTWIPSALEACGLIFTMELCVDWLKHGFITKFNNIPPSIFQKYSSVLYYDIIACRTQSGGHALDHSHAVSRRLGFISMPLSCLIIRVLLQVLQKLQIQWWFVLLGFVIICLLKVLLSVVLLGHACRKVLVEDCLKSNRGQPEESLFKTDRYAMHSKRIP